MGRGSRKAESPCSIGNIVEHRKEKSRKEGTGTMPKEGKFKESVKCMVRGVVLSCASMRLLEVLRHVL